MLAALERVLADTDQFATDQAALTRSLIPAVLAADRDTPAVETEPSPTYSLATPRTDQN